MRAMQVPPVFNFATDVVDVWARKRPSALGLYCVDGQSGREQKHTFAELSRLSQQAANVFRAHGLRRGDRVLVMLPRIAQWWVTMVGLMRLGVVPIPAPMQLSPRDIAFRLEAAEIRGVITTEEGVAKVDGFDGIKFSVGGASSGWVDFDSEAKAASGNITVEPTRSDETGIIYFTSATTGDPKMVVHSHASYSLAHRVTGELWLDGKPDDLHWNVSDLGWAKAAWSSLYGPWHMGSCIFAFNSHGKFDASQTLDVLANFPVTTWCVPPTALRMIVRQDLARRSFPHLRHCVTAGEPLNPEVFKAWKAATGLELYEGYGQTETIVLVGNFRSLNRPVQPGSMGQVTPGLPVVLVDEKLREVPAGQEGEIALRMKPSRPFGLFQEYRNNPSEMAAHFRGDLYLTCDRAVRDKDGYFWFVGRQDDVIKSSGYRIGPFEVESVLLEHAAVLDVAVVGKPDEARGQLVKAFVILRPEMVASEHLKRELQQHCKAAAAPYKYPREIEFVKELPKTISGKTRRVELRMNEMAARAVS